MTSRFKAIIFLPLLLFSVSNIVVMNANKGLKKKQDAPLSAKKIAQVQQEYNAEGNELIVIPQIPGDKKSFSIRRGDGK